MEIADKSVVALHFDLSSTDGEVLESSREGEPLVYMHGSGMLVPGLEAKLLGKSAEDHVDATIDAKDGYGEHDARLDLRVPIKFFPEDVQGELQPGVQFQGPHPEDEERPVLFTVIEREEEELLVTGNHPLAGKTLVFSIDVVSVREATEEELEHGHAHGPGGAH